MGVVVVMKISKKLITAAILSIALTGANSMAVLPQMIPAGYHCLAPGAISTIAQDVSNAVGSSLFYGADIPFCNAPINEFIKMNALRNCWYTAQTILAEAIVTVTPTPKKSKFWQNIFADAALQNRVMIDFLNLNPTCKGNLDHRYISTTTYTQYYLGTKIRGLTDPSSFIDLSFVSLDPSTAQGGIIINLKKISIPITQAWMEKIAQIPQMLEVHINLNSLVGGNYQDIVFPAGCTIVVTSNWLSRCNCFSAARAEQIISDAFSEDVRVVLT